MILGNSCALFRLKHHFEQKNIDVAESLRREKLLSWILVKHLFL